MEPQCCREASHNLYSAPGKKGRARQPLSVCVWVGRGTEDKRDNRPILEVGMVGKGLKGDLPTQQD